MNQFSKYLSSAIGLLLSSVPTIAHAQNFSGSSGVLSHEVKQPVQSHQQETEKTFDTQAKQCAEQLLAGQYEAAVATCKLATKTGNSLDLNRKFLIAMVWRNQAMALTQLQRWENAIAAYEQAIAINPEDIMNWIEQGMLLEKVHQTDRALISFRHAVHLNSESSLALARYCSILNQLGNYQEAIGACESALVGDGDWGSGGVAFVWNQHSHALIGLRQYDTALASADRAIDLQPDYADAWNNKAVSLWHLKDLDAALLASKRATASDATNAQFWFNQGRIFSALEQYENAVVAYDQAIQSNRSDNILTDILANKGAALWHLQRYQQALEATNQAIELNSKSFIAWYNQGVVLTDLGQYDRAIKAYEQANLIRPNHVATLTGKGIALMGLKNNQEALAMFELALNLDPTYLMAQQKRDELLEIFKSGVEKKSK